MVGMIGDRLRKWLRSVPRPAEGGAAAETVPFPKPAELAASNGSAATGLVQNGLENEAVTPINGTPQTAGHARRLETWKEAPAVIETPGDSQNAE
jgi:hypothetical protein